MSIRRVALTGGIATGKSHILTRMHERGVATIDSDTLAREAVAPGTAGLAAVVDRFGAALLKADGALDRAALGRIVFADPAARRDLEAIVHPHVRSATDAWFATLDPARNRFAVADIPLLFEVGRDNDFDVVIVAACDPDTQLRRIMHRDGVSEPEARQRLAAQWPIAEKVARADYVIHTDGSYDDTNRQTDEILAALASGR